MECDPWSWQCNTLYLSITLSKGTQRPKKQNISWYFKNAQIISCHKTDDKGNKENLLMVFGKTNTSTT